MMSETTTRRARPRPRFVTKTRRWIPLVGISVLIGIACAGFLYMQHSTQDGYDAGRRMHEAATTGEWTPPAKTELTATTAPAPNDWDLAFDRAVRFIEPHKHLPFAEVAGRYGDSGVGAAWLCTRTGMAMNQLPRQTIEDCFFWSLAGRMRSPHFPDFPDEATRHVAIRAGIDEMIRRQGWSTVR